MLDLYKVQQRWQSCSVTTTLPLWQTTKFGLISPTTFPGSRTGFRWDIAALHKLGVGPCLCAFILCALFAWVATASFLKPTAHGMFACVQVGDIFSKMLPFIFIYVSKDWKMLLENPGNTKHFEYFCHSKVQFRHFSNCFLPLIKKKKKR